MAVEEPSIGRRMRVMTLIDCVAGYAERPNGPPITILTLACGEQIEQPLMLSIDDTQSLFIKCVESLATHGDDFAKYSLEKYLTEKPGADTECDTDDDEGEEWKKR
jgi:hypothetical protein